MTQVTHSKNIVYLADRHDPWPEPDVRFVDGFKDLWLEVIGSAMVEYRNGVRKGQHRKLRRTRVRHSSGRDRTAFLVWLAATHWLLSDDTSVYSFLWVCRILSVDQDDIRAGMKRLLGTQDA